MRDDVDIGALDRRARTAGYRDGLLELFAATVLLTIAAAWLIDAAFVGILAAFIALYGWKVVERIRARTTFPRVGYHRERADEPNTTARGMLTFIGGAFVLMVVVILISGDLSDASDWRRAAPLLSGTTLAGGFWYAGAKSGLVRYRLIAGLSLVSGVALWWFGSGDSYAGVAVHLVVLAVPLAVIGVWSLIMFLRAHPVRDPADG